MQQMGKLVDPATGKAEPNLDMAQQTIDLLTMLEAKTKGNLDKDEERLLKETLSSLQLTYVETAAKLPPPQPAPAAEAQAPVAETKAAASADESKAKPEEPKFHKKYN